jgi:hypothetical protein
MCSGAGRLSRCEAKKGKKREKLALPCLTGFKACFLPLPTEGLRWMLDHCFINDGLRRLLIRCWVGGAGGSLASMTPSSAPCGPPPGKRLRPSPPPPRPSPLSPPPPNQPPPLTPLFFLPAASALAPRGPMPGNRLRTGAGLGTHGAHLLRQHHRLHSAGCRLRAGLGRPGGQGTAGTSLARITSTSVLCFLSPGRRPWQAVGRRLAWSSLARIIFNSTPPCSQPWPAVGPVVQRALERHSMSFQLELKSQRGLIPRLGPK